MLTTETALQILAPAIPRRRVSAPGLAHPKPLNANSNQRMERQLAFVLLGEPVQRQRGSFAGLSLHRCQPVLQSSLLQDRRASTPRLFHLGLPTSTVVFLPTSPMSFFWSVPRLRGRLSGWQHRTSASSDKLSSKPAERSP